MCCRGYEWRMASREFSDYPAQEGEEPGHRHPGRAPVSGGRREGGRDGGGGGEERRKEGEGRGGREGGKRRIGGRGGEMEGERRREGVRKKHIVCVYSISTQLFFP